MYKRLIFLVFVCLAASGAAQAQDGCGADPVKACEMRKRPGCGPVSLNYWQSGGMAHCEQASVPLSQERTKPQLRPIECFFSGEDTRVRVTGNNFLPQDGVAPGDVIVVQNGSARVQVVGNYERDTRDSRVGFENIGPGGVVVFNCLGYGPG